MTPVRVWVEMAVRSTWVNHFERERDMRNLFRASGFPAAALAIALFAVTDANRAYGQSYSKNRGGSSERGRSNSGGGSKSPTVNTPKSDVVNGPKSGTGNSAKTGIGNAAKSGTVNSFKPVTPDGLKGATGTSGKSGDKGPGKASWNDATKNGWNKNGWNSNFNSQHQLNNHGYWNNGIWVLPLILAGGQPWYYMQPTWTIVPGQKWLGVTYEPYAGGGAYVTGVYENSPGAPGGPRSRRRDRVSQRGRCDQSPSRHSSGR